MRLGRRTKAIMATQRPMARAAEETVVSTGSSSAQIYGLQT